MKKIFSVIVALALLLSIFTACSVKKREPINLKQGFYQSSKAEELGEFEHIGITLSEENKCEVSFSMTGDFFYGSYSIEDDSLICKLTRLQGEYIKTLETNIEYHFSIVDEQTLEFEKVVGKVGKYVYTIDGTEYDFETQLSHFEEGETFVYYVEETDSDIEDTSSKAHTGSEQSSKDETHKPVSSKPTASSSDETNYFPDPVEISHFGTIQKGGVYTVGNKLDNETIITYNEGQKMPSKCSEFDTYTFGDYKYRYTDNHFEYGYKGWIVEVLDENKKEYGPILTSINNMPVVSLFYTFDGCKNLRIAPAIPKKVMVVDFAFRGCSSLKVAPIIPDEVTRLFQTFKDCTVLETVTQFPKKLTALEYTFENCKLLKSVPAIPNSVTNLSYSFKGCQSLTKAPKLPDGVLYMIGTFYDCKNLKEISSIPSKVEMFSETFVNCASLKSVPEFPAKVVQFWGMFEGCSSLEKITNIPEIEFDPSNIGNPNQLRGISFDRMFYGCSSLKSVPAIPDGVESMKSTFENCSALKVAPVLPDCVRDLTAAFKNCTSLQNAPVIHEKVQMLVSTFEGCCSLTGEVVINAAYEVSGADMYEKCFYGTVKPIKLRGKTYNSTKYSLASTSDKGNITIIKDGKID